MTILVISPGCTDDSAKLLAEALEADYLLIPKRIHECILTSYVTHVFNYGSSVNILVDTKYVNDPSVVNKPTSVNVCRNKLEAHKRLLNKVPMPLYTEDKETARGWLKSGRSVVCRAFVKSSKSNGVLITDDEGAFEEAPAKYYTRYINHVAEYRLNCWKGECLSAYEKKVDKHLNFKFILQKSIEERFNLIAKIVYDELGIDWCGIDVLKTVTGKIFLLEVNSGPILFPTTLKRLVNKLKKEFV